MNRKFIKELLDPKGNVSSKRFAGLNGIFLVIIITGIKAFTKVDLPPNILALLTTIFISSCVLLGVSLTNAFSKNGEKT